jgi:hypothetical protein
MRVALSARAYSSPHPPARAVRGSLPGCERRRRASGHRPCARPRRRGALAPRYRGPARRRGAHQPQGVTVLRGPGCAHALERRGRALRGVRASPGRQRCDLPLRCFADPAPPSEPVVRPSRHFEARAAALGAAATWPAVGHPWAPRSAALLSDDAENVGLGGVGNPAIVRGSKTSPTIDGANRSSRTSPARRAAPAPPRSSRGFRASRVPRLLDDGATAAREGHSQREDEPNELHGIPLRYRVTGYTGDRARPIACDCTDASRSGGAGDRT